MSVHQLFSSDLSDLPDIDERNVDMSGNASGKVEDSFNENGASEESADEDYLIPTPLPEDEFPDIMVPFRNVPVIDKPHDDRLLRKVRVYHPYYTEKDCYDCLLEFVTTDGGAQYIMVYYASCILANNAMHPDEGRDPAKKTSPFLSKSPEVKDRYRIPPNDLLPSGDYFFIIPDERGRLPRGIHWAIVPTFDDWSPPKRTPKPWRDVEIPFDPKVGMAENELRIKPCYLSNCLSGVDLAYIIPKQETAWAKRSHIFYSVIGSHAQVLEDWRNKIPLRKDLHFIWDHGFLNLVPKSIVGGPNKDYKLCIHVNRLTGNTGEGFQNIHKYQNTIIDKLCGVPARYLFIRFAWSIFCANMMPFFKTQSIYKVSRLVRVGGTPLDDERKEETLSNSNIFSLRSGSSRRYWTLFQKGQKRDADQISKDAEYHVDLSSYSVPVDEDLFSLDSSSLHGSDGDDDSEIYYGLPLSYEQPVLSPTPPPANNILVQVVDSISDEDCNNKRQRVSVFNNPVEDKDATPVFITL
ncbi:hypothetical protein F5Y11DRAFT_342834 [Daldinia sp. FL1419]|nr:hypothetical protein F5Y11DRAFT_342834 [Daldinia sp. FL1419]